MTGGEPRRVRTLQHLRAVAALSVVLYHASFYTRHYTGDASFLAAFGGWFGTVGVLVFFALSGHLMAVQAVRMRGRPMLFMVHRLVRIYPIFWLVGLVWLAVFFALGEGRFDPLVLMLAPVGERSYPLGVEWTLVFEVGFYLFVGAVVALRLERWIGLIGAGWALAIVMRTTVSGPYAPMFSTGLLQMPMSMVCFAFAAGLTVPSLLARGWVGASALPLGALVLAAANLPGLAPWQTILNGAGCAALVAWAAWAPEGGRAPVLERLGDWSYATYLLHVPALMALGVLSGTGSRRWLWLGMVALVLLLTPLFGALDVRLHAGLRRAGDRMRWTAQAGLLAAFVLAYVTTIGLSAAQARREERSFGPVTIGAAGIEALDRAGWRQDARLAGNLEGAARAGEAAVVSGWVNDPADPLNRTAMLLVAGGRAFVAEPRSYRIDVVRAFGLPRALAPTEFRRTVPGSDCPAGTPVQAVALSWRDKLYRPLNAIPCPG